LGTATFLTDGNGLPYEFFLNLPFGETMAEQHSQTADYENRYKFTGHELDRETGLYYAGARYYDPKISIWLSVDPLVEEFPNWNPYNYTMQNPINLVDPTGMSPEENDDIIINGKNNSSITIVTDLIDIEVNAGSIVGDLGGNYTFQGEEILVAALDIVGVIDPSGAADVAAGSIEMKNGNIWSGLASYAGVFPLAGDLAKVGKINKHINTIENAIGAVKAQREQVTKVFSTRKKALDARPKPAPAKPNQKQVTHQTRNKSGEGKKFKTDGGSQTPHVHDINHSNKKKPNVHYRVGTKKIKP
jgi:RHS repeat-associated protein